MSTSDQSPYSPPPPYSVGSQPSGDAPQVETLPVDEFCQEFAVGSWGHGWDEERAFLEEDNQAYLDALATDVQVNGFRYPVTVVNETVMNGHHRVVVAMYLALDVPFVRGFQSQDYHGAEGNKWTPPRHLVVASQADRQPDAPSMTTSAPSREEES